MPLRAQYVKGAIDRVIDFRPGEGQNTGQSDEYFPENIFGRPSENARENFQAALPSEVCSIGFGGEIIVAFEGYTIMNGPGPDFVVFENAFLNPVTKRIFAEPAVVSVSRDGVNFIEFEYDPATLDGCAGVTPTHGDRDPFDPEVSGGDKFDLDDLGLQSVKYIKIKDISRMVKDNPDHKYYDPIITGFDLDAVVGLNLGHAATSVYKEKPACDIVQYGDIIRIKVLGDFKYRLADIAGRVIYSGESTHYYTLRIGRLESGFYILQVNCGDRLYTKKIIK